MPRLRDPQTTFTKGEIDSALRARIDVAAYRNGADKLRNVVIAPQGGARRRPGTVYVDTVAEQVQEIDISSGTWSTPNGGTAGNLYDDDTSTALTTTTNISTVDPYIVWSVDLGADTTIKYIDCLQLDITTGGPSDEFVIEGQEDGGSWETITHFFDEVSTTKQDFRVSPTKDYRHVRLVKKGGTDLAAAKVDVGEVKMWAETGSISNSRQFGFVFADTQRYLMVLTDRNLRIYRNTGGAETFQVDVSIPHVHADLLDVTYAIDADTLILFHKDYQPYQVVRSGAHDEWQGSDITFSNIPQYDFGDGNEDTWSDTRGWPQCGVFFQSRLVMGGSTERPSTVIASVTSSPFDLDNSTTDDNKAIVYTLAPSGEEIATILHIVVGPHLALMTSSGEYYEPNSDSRGITPTNTSFRLATRAGMDSLRLVPEAVDGAIYFVQREGQSIREFIFSEVERNYAANVVSLLSSHLVRTPLELAYRRQLSTNETNLLFYVNSDGTIAAFTILRSQEIAAFTLLVTRLTDSFVGAASVKDDLYAVADRDVNGATVRLIERFDFDVHVDCAVTGGAASSASVAHLEGETVAVLLDGAAQNDLTVSGGSVTFPRASATSYEVGLPWPDVKQEEDDHQLAQNGVVTEFADGESQVWVRLLPPPVQLPGGPMWTRRRRSPTVFCSFQETQEAVVNGNRVAFRSFGDSLLDEAVPKFTGIKRVGGLLGWSREDAPEITQTEHVAFTLLGCVSKYSTD